MKPMHLSILLDHIQEYYKILYDISITDLSFTQPRIFDPSMKDLEDNFIYLTKDTFVLEQDWCESDPKVLILQVDNPSEIQMPNVTWKEHLIFLCSGKPFFELYNHILDLFTKYQLWYDRSMELILENKPLSELLDYATTYLNNPIAFFDPTGVVLHQTGSFQKDIQGTLWNEVVYSGFTPIKSIHPDEHSRIMQEIKQGSKIILSIFRQDPSHHALTIPIQIDGNHAGALGTTDINAPFTDAQKNLLLVISSLIETAIKHQIQASILQEEENYYVIRLLQGFSVDERATMQYLKKKNLKNVDIWYLYQFPLPEPAYAQTRKSAYLNQIGRVLSNAILLFYENSIIGICRKKDFDPQDSSFIKKLQDMLNHLSMNVFVSYCFSKFTELSVAYNQCLLMKEYIPVSLNSIRQFQESFQQILYGVLEEKTSLKGFCHPTILSLWESQSEHLRTLVYDLKYYLLHGRNIAETARCLNLHRNTFIYRLQKLEDYLQLSLNSLDENMLLYLLLSCMICENKETII